MPSSAEELFHNLNDRSPPTLLPQLLASYESWKSEDSPVNAEALISNYNTFIHRIDTNRDYVDAQYKDMATDMFSTVCLAVMERNVRILPIIVLPLARILLVDTYAEKVMRANRGAEMLAWFICAHAPIFRRSNHLSAPTNFVQLIEKFTGGTISNPFEPSIENAVTSLYGPVCWDLYGRGEAGTSEADTAVLIARELAKVRPPFAHNKVHAIITCEVNLPGEIL